MVRVGLFRASANELMWQARDDRRGLGRQRASFTAGRLWRARRQEAAQLRAPSMAVDLCAVA